MNVRVGRYWGYLAIIAAVAIVLIAAISIRATSEETITPNDRFFKESIGPSPKITADSYYLQVDGDVTTELNLTLNDILAFPEVNETTTLLCVTGGSGTAVWKGVQLSEILNRTGISPSAKKVIFHCADGYDTSLTVEDCLRSDVILSYGMNGEVLPKDQGYPIRLVVPNEYGYKWAKWVNHIEVTDQDHLGYWESRGWSDDAHITTISNWWIHVILLSVAFVLGAFSAVSGVDQKLKRLGLSRRFHRSVSYAFAIVMIPTFIYWVIETLALRGNVFYTFHGQLGLASTIVLAAGAITGILVIRGRDVRLIHMALNLIAYGLLAITIVLGIMMAL